MATKVLKSIKGRRMRVTRQSNCGVPVVGTCSSVVSEGFISVTISGEVEAGDEYLVKNAWGDFCINEKDPDRLKWVNVSINMCEVDPDVMDIMANATVLVDAASPTPNKIGVAFTEAANEDSFAIEVWTKIPNEACVAGTPEWGYFIAQFVKNGRIDGDWEISNSALNATVLGNGFASVPTADWGPGPYGDNPLLVATGLPEGVLFAAVRTTVAPPALTTGCAAVS